MTPLSRVFLVTACASALFGCAGRSIDRRIAPTHTAKLIPEQRLTGPIRLAEDVLAQLEPSSGPVPALDTGGVGSDEWAIDVAGMSRATLGAATGTNCEVTLIDPGGRAVTVRSGEALPISLGDGRYRLRIRNLSAQTQYLWAGWREAQSRSDGTPGIYVEEIAAPPVMVAVGTGAPVFIGVITRGPKQLPVPIQSYREFQDSFATPDLSFLDDGVRTFFENGGQVATVVGIGGNTLSEYDAAVDSIDFDVPQMAVVASDAPLLPLADWAAVQNKMLDEVAGRTVVVIDPSRDHPDLDDADTYRDAITSDQLNSGAFYFPFLRDSAGRVVPPSGAALGIWATVDNLEGPWAPPAGQDLPLTGLASAIPIDDQGIAYLLNGGNKPINPIRELVGGSTVIWGNRVLGGDFGNDYVSLVRLRLYLEATIKTAVQSFVFAPNDENTWEAVRRLVTSFLTQTWQQGGLVGNSASQAFTVSCGLGTTMTPNDILNGYLIVSVAYAPVIPAEYDILTFTQEQAQ